MQSPKTFSLEIEKVAQDKNINHMDAVLWYCSKNDLEPDTVGRLITKGLKEKIEANARELNFLEKTAQLPIQEIMVMSINAKNAFSVLEDLQLKNRVKELEADNAELVVANEELRERCKKLASRMPEWPKGYRPTRRAFVEKKKYERPAN